MTRLRTDRPALGVRNLHEGRKRLDVGSVPAEGRIGTVVAWSRGRIGRVDARGRRGRRVHGPVQYSGGYLVPFNPAGSRCQSTTIRDGSARLNDLPRLGHYQFITAWGQCQTRTTREADYQSTCIREAGPLQKAPAKVDPSI